MKLNDFYINLKDFKEGETVLSRFENACKTREQQYLLLGKTLISGSSKYLPSIGYYHIKCINCIPNAQRDEDDYIATAFWKYKLEEDFDKFKVEIRLNPLANKVSVSSSKNIFGNRRDYAGFSSLIDRVINISEIFLDTHSYCYKWQIV